MKAPDLIANGYHIEDGFMPEDQCKALLESVQQFRLAFKVPEIYRNVSGRPLKYSVIDGKQIKEHLTYVHELLDRIRVVTAELSGESIAPLDDERVACNVNITSRGGAYRWHYDRNRFTALLYLNEVEGGETEMYPRYRLNLGSEQSSRLQRFADKALQWPLVKFVFGKHVEISPKPGRLLIMKGDTCLHSVRPVTSAHDRINIVLSYDTPGRKYRVSEGLDSYLYSASPISSPDPNYSD